VEQRSQLFPRARQERFHRLGRLTAPGCDLGDGKIPNVLVKQHLSALGRQGQQGSLHDGRLFQVLQNIVRRHGGLAVVNGDFRARGLKGAIARGLLPPVQGYGKLKKNEVYVRRGSSTDPTKPATPEEIALMGTASGSQNAELVVEFAAIGRDSSLGTSLSWDAEFCEMPQRKDIPDYGAEGRYALLESSLVERTNTSFYRQLAEYEFVRRLFRPVRLVVTNTGQVAANEVRVELTIPAGQAVEAIYRSDLPETPRRRNFLYNLAAVQNLRPALRHPGGVTIRKNKERIKIEVECGNLQPGRRVWSEVLYLGMGTTGNISLSGQVFAGNLPQPKDFNLTVTVNVTRSTITVAQLRSLPEPNEDS
jgi:hypothetical protein